MKTFASTIAVAAALAQCVAGHAMFQQAAADGKDYGTMCARVPSSNSPVSDVSSPAMACNVNGGTPVAGICDAKAGGRFTVEMHSQPNDRSCTSQAIGGNHFGPVIVYMAKVADATTASPSGLSWFKVDEEGYDAAAKVWGTDSLNKNCGKREFAIPSKIPAGDYLVRAEAIALHAAGQAGGAQFYMTCYQVKVAGGSGGQLPAGVSIPGAYGASDPGVKVDIYQGLTKYTIPGPAVVDQSFF
ncbi:glycoside hydrolase [Podospora conica]|nr:glycoside hydrolase [Schizothecium conicum]